MLALVDDNPDRIGTNLLGYPVRGPEALAELRSEGVADAFAGIGGVGSSEARQTAFTRLVEQGFRLPSIVHASAVVSRFARIGNGCHVLALAVVNADAELGDDVIVNTAAVVEHDCRIGPHVHVGPGALLGGLVTVGSDAQIGMGAVVIQECTVGDGALVAAGAVVVDDVAPGARVAGIPARPMS